MSDIKIYTVGEFKIVQIEMVVNGVNTAKCFSPDADISNEIPEVQAACNKAWTPEIIAAYEAHKEATV